MLAREENSRLQQSEFVVRCSHGIVFDEGSTTRGRFCTLIRGTFQGIASSARRAVAQRVSTPRILSH